MQASRGERINSVQYLRALAALAVAAFHTIGILKYLDSVAISDAVGTLANGVDLFFVISGFIMMRNFDKRPTGAAEFIANRLIRIAPLYYLATLLQFGVSQIVPHLQASATLRNLAASLAFYPWWENPVLLQGWTLNVEIAFYLLFATAIAVAPARVLPLCVAAIAAVALGGLAWQPTSAVARFYTNPIITEFALGMIVARWWQAQTCPPALAVALLLAGLVTVPLLPIVDGAQALPRGLVVQGAVTCILLGALSVEKAWPASCRNRLGILLGNASFSIYLTHGFVVLATSVVAKHIPWIRVTTAGHLTYVVGTIAASAIVGCWVHLRVEDPLLVGLRRRTPQASKTVPVISTP